MGHLQIPDCFDFYLSLERLKLQLVHLSRHLGVRRSTVTNESNICTVNKTVNNKIYIYTVKNSNTTIQ